MRFEQFEKLVPVAVDREGVGGVEDHPGSGLSADFDGLQNGLFLLLGIPHIAGKIEELRLPYLRKLQVGETVLTVRPR